MKFHILFFLLISAVSSSAQSTAEACFCKTTEHNQFKFWVGEWNVYDTAGTKVGENSITAIEGNCALVENWRSAKGSFTGTSLNRYDPVNKTWNQMWVDNRGGTLNLTGGWNGTAMRMRSATSERSGQMLYDEITWTPIDGNSLRQVWTLKNDSGKVIKTLFNGLYERK